MLFFSSAKVFAQPDCAPEETQLRRDMNTLLAELEQPGGRNASNVDQFVNLLPLELRRDPIFMAQSESIQGGSVAEPRVIVKSPSSEIVYSFGNSAHSGGDHIEMIVYNADASPPGFEMIEVSFNNGRAQVNRNPRKCQGCHGNAPASRPIWQTYRFWQGQVPHAEDTLHEGTAESRWYTSYIDRIEREQNNVPPTRYGALRPPFTSAEITAELEANGTFSIPNQPGAHTFNPNDGSGSDLSNQQLMQNACRIIKQTAARPDWDQIKYALAASLKGCSSTATPVIPIADFLPPHLQAVANTHFTVNGQGYDPNTRGFSRARLLADTERRLQSVTVDKLEAQRQFLNNHQSAQWTDRNLAQVDRLQRSTNDERSGPKFGYKNWENDIPSV